MNILVLLNFILFFVLADFFVGRYKNYLYKVLRRGFLVFALIISADAVLCIFSLLWPPLNLILLSMETILILMLFCADYVGSRLSRYEDAEAGKHVFFGNQTVMLFAPHEDDDLNLVGGVIEEYVKHNSTVYVVFSTNGDGLEGEDATKSGTVRMKEAIRVLGFLGVPEENVFFLGYGDGWDKKKGHIYNCAKEEIVSSDAGYTKTYGLSTHPAYHDGRIYTYNHYMEDIKSIILEYYPDVLYCVDYDLHNDHRSLSMMFEKVMGEILHSTDYRPEVYKGYAYRTAWNAPKDFGDSVNILSTAENQSEGDILIYPWEQRVRIPIDVRSVNRSLKQSKLYKALAMYQSQQAQLSAAGIINGDKVFWKRRTDSLCYNAKITVSSGDAEKLTDFMMLDCDNLYQNGEYPYNGIWHPEEDDREKKIKVEFASPGFIKDIVLYDNPSPNDNIKNAVILIDGETVIQTGKLNSNGQATRIAVNKKVCFFEIILDSFEGDNYGLTEIELFSSSDKIKEFYKIVDEKSNFVYDYILPQSGMQKFYVYSNTESKKNFKIHCTNKKCKVNLLEKGFEVFCPRGQKSVLILSGENGIEYDKVIIRNPSKIERRLLEFQLGDEKQVVLHKTFSYKAIRMFRKKGSA